MGKGNLTGHRYQPWQGRQAQWWEKKSGRVKKGIVWEGENKKILKRTHQTNPEFKSEFYSKLKQSSNPSCLKFELFLRSLAVSFYVQCCCFFSFHAT